MAALPFPCNKISGPSLDGRFVLCTSRQGVVVIDTKKKTAVPFGTLAQHYAWVDDDTLMYSRDLPDMSVRGTWMRTIGGFEKQVIKDPYKVGRDGVGAVAIMRETNLVCLAAGGELLKMQTDGDSLTEVTKLQFSTRRIEAVKIWSR